MKVRRLIRYYVGSQSSNPGAAGAKSYPTICSEEVLQYRDEDEGWVDVPVVRDSRSRKEAEEELKKRRGY